jgi:MFS superfamily sulfate permease-like transporter
LSVVIRSLRGFAVPLARLPGEAAAGASVAAVAIPVGLAYAEIVGVPPVIGLYASIVPPLAYALVGPSRYLVVGPDTATCMVIAATLASLGVSGAEARAAAAPLLALLAGFGLLSVRALRLGFIANLFSRPVLVGYMTGIALILLTAQASSWTAVELRAPGIFRPLLELARRAAEIHWPCLALAAGLFAIIRLLRRFAPRLPGPAIAVVVAVALASLLDLPAHGVPSVGRIPTALPALRLPAFSGSLSGLLTGMLGVVAISFASGILTARSFGERLGEATDVDRELVGLGAANLAAGLFQGFSVTGADSRTAVGLASGGQTRWTGVAAALFVALAVTVLSGPLSTLPNAALGAILASAAIDLIDLRAFRHIAAVSRYELGLALAATAAVIWIGVLVGVFLAVGLTLLNLLHSASQPRSALMGRLPGETAFVTLDRNPTARPVEGVAVFLFEAPILFLNAGYFRQQAIAAHAACGPARWFVLDASLMTRLDSSAYEALEHVRADLERAGTSLLIAGGHDVFLKVLGDTGFVDRLEGGRLFASPEAAIAAIGAPIRDARPSAAPAAPAGS